MAATSHCLIQLLFKHALFITNKDYKIEISSNLLGTFNHAHHSAGKRL